MIQSFCEQAVIGAGAVVGPFAHLTAGTEVPPGAQVEGGAVATAGPGGAGGPRDAAGGSGRLRNGDTDLAHGKGELGRVTGITVVRREEDDAFLRPGLTRNLATEIAGCLGIEPTPTTLYDFANGEIFVRFLESVRGSDAFVLQSHTAPINQWIMEQLIMVDALKRASAKRITVVAPFFGYARQDKKSRGREPISARLMADLFRTAGADRLMAVDLHTAQIQGFFDGPVDHLFALPILASYLEAQAGRVAESRWWRRTPAGCGSASGGRTGSAARWPSSTSAAIRTSPTRSRCSRSSGRWPGGLASWWTT